MKRSCDRCRALSLSFNMKDVVCRLYYDIDDTDGNPKPKTECPKPTTHSAYLTEKGRR